MSEISLLFPELRVSRRAIIGVTEDIEVVGEHEFANTVNGRAILLKPSFRTKYRVRLQADGTNVWTPSVDDLQPGDLVTLHASTWWSTTVGPGQTQKLLIRDPVPGSISGRDAADETIRVPVAVAGRVATLPGRGGFTTILYRPVLHCIVGPMAMGGSATSREQHWSLDLMEEFAP